MIEVQFNGETIELINDRCVIGDVTVFVWEASEGEWIGDVTFLSHGYTRSAISPSTKPSRQEALDFALEQWDIVSAEARADALEVVAAIDLMDSARAAI